MGRKRLLFIFLVLFGVIAGFSGCQKSRTTSTKNNAAAAQQTVSGNLTENPLAPEKNPPGDIPDSQVFVKYVSAQGGYALEVPEGWARTTNGSDVAFTFHFDGLSVTVTHALKQPGADGIRTTQADNLKKTGQAVRIKSIENVEIAGNQAVLMVYESNSEADTVTNKQVRLENDTYFLYRDGRLAALRLWAPLGADNVDQWKQIANSFKWS